MIFDLSITPASVTEVSEARLSAAAPIVQRLLAETVRAYGAVRFSTPLEARQFLEHVRSPSLTQGERKLWQELLVELRTNGRLMVDVPASSYTLRAAADVQALEGLRLGGTDHLFVLPDEQFDAIFPNSASRVQSPWAGLGIATALNTDSADIVVARRELVARGSHPRGYSRDAVWEELFGAAARFAGEIVVVDRYLFNEVVGRDNAGVAADEHVVWFLKKLALFARPGIRVTLIAGKHTTPAINDPQAIIDLILRRWGRTSGSVTELQVILATTHFPHNRHIRFATTNGLGLGLGYDLYEGLDRLRSPALWDVDGFTWQFRWRRGALDSMVTREQRVAGYTSSVSATVTI